MEKMLREYIEHLFESAPQSRKAYELQEEMIQNLTEKYKDLLAEGKSEDAAYNIAVGGIGDISELFNDLEDKDMKPVEPTRAQKKSAILTTVAVMLFILCALPLIIIDYLGGNELVGLVILFVFVAAATGILVYNGLTKPRYQRSEDTVVEDFREFQSKKSVRKELIGAINGAMWCIIVAAYFVISFVTQAWYITWVIFIIGAAISNIISLCFRLGRG